MVLDPIPQSVPEHFFGSRPQPPTSYADMCPHSPPTYRLEASPMRCAMRWLTLGGPLQLYVTFAEYSLFYRALLQKRPVILRSLLVVATPYRLGPWDSNFSSFSVYSCSSAVLSGCRGIYFCLHKCKKNLCLFPNVSSPSSVLQCVAVCCSVLQCVAACACSLTFHRQDSPCSTLQRTAAHCSILHCSMLVRLLPNIFAHCSKL